MRREAIRLSAGLEEGEGMTSGPKTVFFHVGTIKTGSTFIQKFFYDNRAALNALGVDYPFFSPPRLDLPRYANADFLLKEGFDARFVADTIEASPCDKIFISEEGLIGRPDVLESRAFAGFEKVAIVYVRPPVDLVASWAAENALPYNFRQTDFASGRGVVPVAEGVKIYCDVYRKLLDKFLDSFSQAPDIRLPDIRLIVRDYDFNAFVGENIIEDILSLMVGAEKSADVKAIYDQYGTRSANEGKSRKYCDVSAQCAEIVKAYKLDAAFNRKFVDQIYAGCSSGDARKVIDTLSDAEMRAICEALAPVYARLHALGYKRGAQDLERELRPKAYQQARAPYTPLEAAEVRLAVADALVRKYVTNAHVRTTDLHGADKNTLAEMREDVKKKTFAVQSLTGQRERLKRFIEIVGQTVEPENVAAVLRAASRTKSQFMQEMFALAFAKGKRGGFFVEFGACDGLHLSNTGLLESEFGWRGVLSEPARTWAEALKKNRAAALDFRCVSSRTGASVEFWEAEHAGTSSVAKVKSGANPISERYFVETVTLVDLLAEHDAPPYVDFLSVDTEGTEYEILAAFDFARYRFGFIAVEQHDLQSDKIAALLLANGYEPLFPRIPKLSKWSHASGFDVWYVPAEAKAGLKL